VKYVDYSTVDEGLVFALWWKRRGGEGGWVWGGVMVRVCVTWEIDLLAVSSSCTLRDQDREDHFLIMIHLYGPSD
jgi:hypothetical protein